MSKGSEWPKIEFMSTFHIAFMTISAPGAKNGTGGKLSAEADFPIGEQGLDLCLTSFECGRYIKENYCNSGIPMFFQRG
jgi:hypothetical protein